MQTVYVETSIVSYLRSRAASHVVAAARQLLTRRWWDEEGHRYDLVISQYVLDEASKGHPTLAAERLNQLNREFRFSKSSPKSRELQTRFWPTRFCLQKPNLMLFILQLQRTIMRTTC
ncbi:MAG: hypothetical protein H7Z17_11060 [Fuerstia sp.]|nr:hypothetical protein [Fuerstiella sp.]